MVYKKRAGVIKKRQAGLTLVELMVALVIGLLIILGATQLFLMGLQSFRQVEALGSRQAVLVFAVDSFVRDVRKGNIEKPVSGKSDTLEVVVDKENGDFCTYVYSLSDIPMEGYGYSLQLKNSCEGNRTEPLVSGFSKDGFEVENLGGPLGYYEISLSLENNLSEDPAVASFIFHVMSRTEAVRGDE